MDVGLYIRWARYKISTLNFVDEIEVYLGYLVKLKKELELPNVESMLFFNISCITEQDLQDAKTFILKNRHLKETYCSFLIEQELWINTLRFHFPKKMKTIETVLYERTGVDECVQALDEYKNELYELTIKLVSVLLFRLIPD